MKTKRLTQSETNRQPESEETRKTRRKLNDLVHRVYDLEYRLNGLVNYSECIANNIESIINYSDFLSTRISRKERMNNSSDLDINVDEAIPTFTEFDRAQRTD